VAESVREKGLPDAGRIDDREEILVGHLLLPRKCGPLGKRVEHAREL
jgi:hypothetical protein